jgi:23S rRNA G2445 N2-methylase RlmL
VERLLELRTVDNLFRFLGECEVGPHRADLEVIGMRCAALIDDQALLGAGNGGARTLWVNASRTGRHRYSRFEAAQAVAEAVVRRVPGWRLGSEREHDRELRLDIDDARAWLSVRLTLPSFRFRGRERAFAKAALRPPVAHALVWLTQPRPNDVFIDPFCGSGTIVLERAAYPAQRIVGGDAAPEALAAARKNLRAAPVELQRWDARALPLEARSVDAMATNLPFGRQVLDRETLPVLYGGLAREVQRVLAPGGVVVALTEVPEVLFGAVERTRLRAERVLTLSLKGLRPAVVRLT